MSRQIQFRRGTADEHAAFTGAIGEVTVDTTNKTLRVHDGETPGGIPLARADSVQNVQTGLMPDYSNGYSVSVVGGEYIVNNPGWYSITAGKTSINTTIYIKVNGTVVCACDYTSQYDTISICVPCSVGDIISISGPYFNWQLYYIPFFGV